MTDQHRIVDVLRHCRARHLGFRAALEHAAWNGVPPEVLLEHAVPGDEHVFDEDRVLWSFDATDEDWVASLAEFAGGEEEAQAVLDRTRRWSGYEVRRHLRLSGVLAVAREALARRASIAEIAEIVRSADGALDHVLREVARRWPLGEVVTSRHLPIGVLQEELPRRGAWPDLADAVFAELTDEIAVAALARVLELRVPDEPALAAVHVRVGLQERANRPLSELAGFASARLTLPRWLGVFRGAGFPPELAALAALDREADVLDAARALRIGGYRDDEIVRGLRACGTGDEQVLDVLSAAGWEPARLVGALRVAGLLDPEIREHLRQLGLSLTDIDELLGTALEIV